MKGLFNSKKIPKKHAAGESADSQHNHNHSHSANLHNEKLQPQVSRSEPSSPAKPTPSSSRSPTKKSARPASPALREQTKSRSSRSYARHSTEQASSSSSRRSKIDTNTHPLNLPPEELKRLSAQYNMGSRSSLDKMDLDKDTPAPPSSPPPAQQQASFTIPVNSPPTNGVKKGPSEEEGDGPAPPPPAHRSNPSSPVPTDAEAAEAHKADGNKFFKQRDFSRAIAEYTSGMLVTISRLYNTERNANLTTSYPTYAR